MLRTGQVSQKFIDGGQLIIIHSSDRTPRHFFAEFMAVWIDAGAHGGDEFRKLPVLDEIEVGSERPHLLGHAEGRGIRGNPDTTGCIRQIARLGPSAAQ
jgi:hypothetical protein